MPDTKTTKTTPALVATREDTSFVLADPETGARLIWRDPERHSGAACFYGTRVPVRTLFDYLAEGEPLAHFLDAYPHIEGDAARAVVRLGGACLAQLAGG
jgi:uncharacterized protein (DUF433 family)